MAPAGELWRSTAAASHTCRMRLLPTVQIVLLAAAVVLPESALQGQAHPASDPESERQLTARILFSRFRTPSSPTDAGIPTLERFILARESQFRYCYSQQGRRLDPA